MWTSSAILDPDFAFVVRQGGMKLSLGTALAISFSLASCAAKNAPARITVRVADTYSDPLHLKPCLESAREPVVVNEQGNGETSACPYGDLEIIVLKQSKTVYITSENISVERAGDGIPATITAQVP
jgi:hypothetical protein